MLLSLVNNYNIFLVRIYTTFVLEITLNNVVGQENH